MTVVRQGMYGTLDVSWQNGFPQGNVLAGFTQGTVVPASGKITIPHGMDEKNFTVEVIYVTRTLFFMSKINCLALLIA